MATLTRKPRTSKPKAEIKVSLCLSIDHTVYAVTPIRAQDGDVIKAWRLVKQSNRDDVYDVAETVHGFDCTCPDFEARRKGLDEAGCKHCKALVIVGLIDAPSPAVDSAIRRQAKPAAVLVTPEPAPAPAPKRTPVCPELPPVEVLAVEVLAVEVLAPAPLPPIAGGAPVEAAEPDHQVEAPEIPTDPAADLPQFDPDDSGWDDGDWEPGELVWPDPETGAIALGPDPDRARLLQPIATLYGHPEPEPEPAADPEPAPDAIGPDRPRLPLADLVDAQAAAYRAWGNDAGDLIARTLAQLAEGIRFHRAATPAEFERDEAFYQMDLIDAARDAARDSCPCRMGGGL